MPEVVKLVLLEYAGYLCYQTSVTNVHCGELTEKQQRVQELLT